MHVCVCVRVCASYYRCKPGAARDALYYRCGVGACEALAELHSRKLAHFDVKPENFFLLKGQPKVSMHGIDEHVCKLSSCVQTHCGACMLCVDVCACLDVCVLITGRRLRVHSICTLRSPTFLPRRHSPVHGTRDLWVSAVHTQDSM